MFQAESRASEGNGVQVRYMLVNGTSDDYVWAEMSKRLENLPEARPVGLSQDLEMAFSE